MDWSVLASPMLSGVVSAAIASFGCYVALTNRLTKLETPQRAAGTRGIRR